MLDDRKLAVLRAIVTDYVQNSEPVGSKALVERHKLDVSSATIRNDMAVLEDEGYLMQPHTSAGRIPTDKGYRLFVDRIAQVKPLSLAEKRAIATFLSGALDLDDIVARTVRLLAQVTQQVAIVQYPQVSTAVLRSIDIVRLYETRSLMVVVSSSGRIAQGALELPPGTTDDELADLRARLCAAVLGLTANRAVKALAGVAEQFPVEQQPLALAAVAGLVELVAGDNSTRVVVGGVPNLGRFGDQFETTVKPVLEALEEQVVLLRLLGDAHADVTVRIGTENENAALRSTSVVASGYGASDDVWAMLGVVGPTRMDYPSTMASVRAVARYVGRILAEG